MPCKFNRSSPCLLCLCAVLASSAACSHPPSQPAAVTASTATRRYPFKGKVISVDKQAGTANINNEPIPRFMDSMVMPYSIKPASTLDQLQPGDSITADVIVEPNKYWLENVKVTGHSKPPESKTTPSVDHVRKTKERDC
jgi:Cu/Ag efflux protein CusF